MNEEPSIYSRPMTLEEISAENAKYQRELHERMAKELPAAMGAYLNNYDDDDEEIEEEIEEQADESRCGYESTNGNGLIRNKYSEVSADQPRESSLMLAVREREIQELRKDKEEISKKYEYESNRFKDTISEITTEKQRAKQSLKEAQDLLFKFKTQNTALLEEKEKLVDSERDLKAEVQLQKFTIQDKDNIIKILENGSQDNRQIIQLEKQLQAKDEKHQYDIKNLNDQLELSFKKCKSLEKEKYELDKKLKCLDKQNDEIVTLKSETISKLTAQIQNLTEDYQRLVTESKNNDRKLRAEIGLMESKEQNLIKELESLKLREGHSPNTNSNVEGSILQSRLVELEKKLTSSRDENHNLTKRITEMEKELVKRGNRISQLEEMNSMEVYNAQYLKFHEEELEKVQNKYKEAYARGIKEKDEMIETLKKENEEVKNLYLTQENKCVEVDCKKLQNDLEMSRTRCLQLQEAHSEFCQPILTDKERLINDLTEENKNLVTKVSHMENSLDSLKTELENISLESKKKEDQLIVNVKEMEILKEKLQRILTEQTGQVKQISTLKEEILKKESFYQKQLENEKVSVRVEAASPVDAVKSSQPVGDSVKTWTQEEVNKLLQDIAKIHDQEQRQYEIRLEALHHQNLFNISQGQKPKRDVATETEVASSELSVELAKELLKTSEKLRLQNEVLTARTLSSETEIALSRISEQLVAATRKCELAESERQQIQLNYQIVTEREVRFKNELAAMTQKYEKLKGQAKHYKEYFSNAISKLKEESKREKRLWQEERNDLEERLKLWEAEKEKREKALLELQADVRNLKVPYSIQSVSAQNHFEKLINNHK